MKNWTPFAPDENRLDSVLRLMVAAIVLLFPAACLLVDRSDTVSLLILLLVGITVWARSGFKANLTRHEWLYVSVFAGFFLAGLVAFELGHQTDSGFRLLGRYLRFLVVFPALIAFKRYRPAAWLVWSGLGLGVLCLGADAVWERYTESGYVRPFGDTNVAILFGDLATLTTFAFAAGYIYVDKRLPRFGPLLMTLGVVSGLLACFLSGARGAWLALPALILLFLTCRHLLHPRTVFLGAATVLIIFVTLLLMPQTHLRERIANTASQLYAYWVITRSLDDAVNLPECIQDPVMLHAWVDVAKRASNDGLSIKVKKFRGPRARALHSAGCEHGTALVLSNAGPNRAVLNFPRTKSARVSAAKISLVTSGNTLINFGHGRSASHHLKNKHFAAVQMVAAPRYGDGFTMIIPPGATVRLVPIETFTGEYRYAMLESSIGQRLEMWSVALRLFSGSPLFGVGSGAYQTEARQLVSAGQAPAMTAQYDHPHNEYLDALSSRGLLGLLSTLALLCVPGWLFSLNLNGSDPVRIGAGLGGLSIVVGLAIFGITESMFIHSITIGWYVIMTTVFMVLVHDTGQIEGP